MSRDAVGVQVHLVEAQERGASSGRRTRAVGRWLFDHRADLLAAVVYGCLAYLSFSALSEYANAHHLFPEPWGGYAFAVAIDGAVLYAFISFSRAPILASLLLTSGAVTSYGLQQWHAAKDLHPAVVAGVVPAAMVLVTFAWHRIRSFRPDWPVPVPQTPAPEEAAPPTAAPPGPVQPDQPQPRTNTNGSRLTADQERQIRAWVAGGWRNKSQMARDLGLNNRGRLAVGRLVDDLVRTNGDHP